MPKNSSKKWPKKPSPGRALWNGLRGCGTCLWESDTSFVIRACQKLAAHSQEAGQAATCFSNNAQRMAYDLFRRPGYMIGSGAVESGCKQIVTQGLKRAGAQWLVAGANQTAKARAVWLSGNLGQ